MNDYAIHILSSKEIRKFEEKFDEKKLERDNYINFKTFKEILENYANLDAFIRSDLNERMRKSKDKQNLNSDEEIYVSKKIIIINFLNFNFITNFKYYQSLYYFFKIKPKKNISNSLIWDTKSN